MVKDCKRKLVEREFLATLYSMTIRGFDVVMEMDWLSEFEAQIVYRGNMIRREF